MLKEKNNETTLILELIRTAQNTWYNLFRIKIKNVWPFIKNIIKELFGYKPLKRYRVYLSTSSYIDVKNAER